MITVLDPYADRLARLGERVREMMGRCADKNRRWLLKEDCDEAAAILRVMDELEGRDE